MKLLSKEKKHIFQGVKVNPSSTGLRLCVLVRTALKGSAERRSCLGREKIKIRFLADTGSFHSHIKIVLLNERSCPTFTIFGKVKVSPQWFQLRLSIVPRKRC